MTSTRTSPSGPAVDIPPDLAGSTRKHLDWAPDGAGQQSNLLTLVTAGHAPGLYLISPHVFVKTVQAGSYLTLVITWSNSGPQSLTPTGPGAGSALSITVAGTSLNNGSTSVPRTPFTIPIFSDGEAAITMQFTTAGSMAGAALLDCYGAACVIGT